MAKKKTRDVVAYIKKTFPRNPRAGNPGTWGYNNDKTITFECLCGELVYEQDAHEHVTDEHLVEYALTGPRK